MQRIIAALPQIIVGLLLAGILHFLLQSQFGGVWDPLGDWLLAASAVTLLAYGADKLIAPYDKSGRLGRPGRWRIRNNTLHGLALAGGFVGGVLGMLFLGHKRNLRNWQFHLILVVSALMWIWILMR